MGNTNNNAGSGDLRVQAGMQGQEICLLSLQLIHLWRELAESVGEQHCRKIATCASMTQLNRNAGFLAVTPDRRCATQHVNSKGS